MNTFTLPKGKDNAKHAKTLALEMGCSDGKTEVAIRIAIRKAIDEGALIGSSKNGFYEIDTIDDYQEARMFLFNKQISLAERFRNLENAWCRKINKLYETQQLELSWGDNK